MRKLRGYEDIEVYGKKYSVRVELEKPGNGNGHSREVYWIDPGTGCPPVVQTELSVGLEWAAAEIASSLIL